MAQHTVTKKFYTEKQSNNSFAHSEIQVITLQSNNNYYFYFYFFKEKKKNQWILYEMQ